MRILFSGDTANFSDGRIVVDQALLTDFSSADFRVCNLEAPIIEGSLPAALPKRGPSLYQSTCVLDLLKACGFTHCSIANNHIADYGFVGLRTTLKHLKDYAVFGAAEEASMVYTPSIIEKNGVRVGLFAIAENGFGAAVCGKGGFALYDTPECFRQLAALRRKVDFLVVCFHAGEEDVDFPLPEWRDIYHKYCDFGVDVIVAHHPHVPQGIEKYRNSLIFYSLGNFYFNYADSTGISYSVICNFERGNQVTYKVIPHEYGNGFLKSASLDIGLLNKLVEQSEERAGELAVEMLEDIYMRYWRAMYFPKDSGNWGVDILRRIRRRFFPRDIGNINGEELLWLCHNMLIDSHRFLQMRALNILYGNILQ